MTNKVLIVVDAQNDFVEGAMAVPGARNAINVIARILGKFDAIVYTQDWHHRNHCSFTAQGGTKPQHCVANSTGAQINQYLPMLLGDIPVKTVQRGRHRHVEGYSAFWDYNQEHETTLGNLLSNLAIRNTPMKLYICGLGTEGCVLNTMMDAVQNYPDIVIIEDACRGRDEDRAQRALEAMAEAGAMILPSACIVDHTPAVELVT